MNRIMKRNKRKNKKKRKSNNSGSSSDKRQRLSGYASEIIESGESEASPENYAGETKESDSDRRGREKKEREQKKSRGSSRKKTARDAKRQQVIKPCLANIGGKRVEKNGIIDVRGWRNVCPFPSRPKAEEATGILISAIISNIIRGSQSSGKKGVFEDQKVMFINAPTAPVDTSDRVHCGHCDKHFSTKGYCTTHVRAKHPEVPLPPVRGHNRMPKEYKMFTPPITPEEYRRIVEKVGSNIKGDLRKCEQKQLMAMVEGVEELPEPLPSQSIKRAATKYHLDEQQILDSIANNEQLTIGVGGRHVLVNELGKTTFIILAGLQVTFSWKHKVTEEDKDKLTKMNNRETRLETYHMIARLICEHMNKEGMFAKKNVIDDNGGLIKNGFEFEYHGGLFNLSFDRIEDEYIVNGQTFYKMHYPDPENALENINVVAFMANVRCKATTKMIQDRYDIYKNKSEDQQKKEFEKVLKISHKKTHNGKRTPLYRHATQLLEQTNAKAHSIHTKPTGNICWSYWKNKKVFAQLLKSRCRLKVVLGKYRATPLIPF